MSKTTILAKEEKAIKKILGIHYGWRSQAVPDARWFLKNFGCYPKDGWDNLRAFLEKNFSNLMNIAFKALVPLIPVAGSVVSTVYSGVSKDVIDQKADQAKKDLKDKMFAHKDWRGLSTTGRRAARQMVLVTMIKDCVMSDNLKNLPPGKQTKGHAGRIYKRAMFVNTYILEMDMSRSYEGANPSFYNMDDKEFIAQYYRYLNLGTDHIEMTPEKWKEIKRQAPNFSRFYSTFRSLVAENTTELASKGAIASRKKVNGKVLGAIGLGIAAIASNLG